MGLKIIKLAVSSEAKIETAPTVTRFFYEVTEPIKDGSTLKIDASQFLDDSGNHVNTLPLLNLNNSYFNVYINGVLQMDDHFAYTAGEEGVGNLLISISEGSIAAGTPIILEVINFDPILKTTLET
ncbi:hypothetical protein BpJC7_24910 [Weizmannia acidilactici]|uniref:DUF4183 domain-containing protein n=1 Tax=Weizmannia acidilactici TaxID=2607726 RepID=A0A5J4JKV8_9BACI|nr:DUF4183 domain-containing protein [Weizmannia acidilactici]GER71188.1 hypothetical protein BpJC7_24910 [Weizmannia acidilactici]GER74831.1 hypothetical protein BpPP18_28980 [Weizmannia acidilactici]